jgi:chromosome segregation ATPase
MPADLVTPVLSRRQLTMLVLLLVLSVGATAALVFGPGRGARQDLGETQRDLESAQDGIYQQLDILQQQLTTLTAQLETTQESLKVQQTGLDVARSSEQIAGQTLRSTESIRVQTTQTLGRLDRVITALGPLRRLKGDLETVVEGVRAGVELARTTLQLAQQTLQNGKDALHVARSTLDTLLRSEGIQRDLLQVARQTLAQVTEVNRKLPQPPIFPTMSDPGVAGLTN